MAERIVVNAREAGLMLNARPTLANAKAQPPVDAGLIRLRMDWFLPRPALAGFLQAIAPMAGLDTEPLPDPARPEDIYDRERAIVNSYRVIPLVYLGEVYGPSPRVKNWVSPLPGARQGWPFASVWLEGEGL